MVPTHFPKEINCTMPAALLDNESSVSTQDSTINCSLEVMKLRSDNERLHFELVQSQARNKELLAAMEERKQESAKTMRELVEEAKDMTKQYYENQLTALRCTMNDMVEEYESRLAKVPASPENDAGMPSRFLQNKVSQLMVEIAVLEEKLTAETLKRARAEKEVERLRACIEERDDTRRFKIPLSRSPFKDTKPPREDVISLSDSEHESEEETNDPLNESLEPIFNKELNKSISIVLQNEKRDNGTIDNIEEECDSELEKSHETLQNYDSKNSTYATDEDEDDSGLKFDELNDNSEKKTDVTNDNVIHSNKCDDCFENNANVTYDNIIMSNKRDDSLKNDTNNVTYGTETTYEKNNESLRNDSIHEDDIIQFKNESIKKFSKPELRETYFVRESQYETSDSSEESMEKKPNSFRSTYFVKDPVTNVSKNSESYDERDKSDQFKVHCGEDLLEKKSNSFRSTYFVKDPVTNVSKKSESYEERDKSDQFKVHCGEDLFEKKSNSFRSTYFVKDPVTNVSKNNEGYEEGDKPDQFKVHFGEDSLEKKSNSFRSTYFVNDPVSNVSKNSESYKGDKSDQFKVPIVREKSNVEIKSPKPVTEERTSKIVREKSNTDMKVTETSSEPISKIIRGKSNMDMKAPETSESVRSLIRAKTNISMKATEKVPETIVGKIMRSFKSNHGRSDVSLTQFEQLEKASKDDDVRSNQSVFGEIKIKYFDNVNNNKPKDKEEAAVVKEKRTYFDNIGANVEICNKNINNVMKSNDDRSPSIVKDFVTDDFESSTIKKLLGESFTKPEGNSSTHITKLTQHISVDIFDGFDSPVAQKTKENVDCVEIGKKFTEKPVLDQLSVKNSSKADLELRLSIREIIEPENDEVKINKQIKLEPISSVEESNGIKAGIRQVKLEPASFTDEPNQTMNYYQAKGDNTTEKFENIYKDISTPRATEFDLLVANESIDKHDKDEAKYNLRKDKTKVDYTKIDKSKDIDEEILAESHAKSESKVRKRPLRLRRRKNQDEESGDDKLKDIVNLQSEFSDVTMGMPATNKKSVKDIPSPEKSAEENVPPLFEIQSCPSKSVTRSRRKLFTPRAEPLEESLTQTGDSNERIYVPRPSYHRPRARRKL